MARIHLLVPLLLALAVATTACANHPTVKVCDPCGCRCVAAPIVTGCGEVPRGPAEPKTDVALMKVPVPDGVKEDFTPTQEEGLEQVLAKKKIRGLEWEETNLDTAITYLRTITGVNFQLSPKVREEKSEDVIYTLSFDDVSVKAVLDVMTEPFGLRWEPRDGVIWILTDEEIDGPRFLRYLHVKDLTGKGHPFEQGDELVEAIRLAVHPTYWDEKDATLELHKGILIARAPRAVLAGIDDFLTHERRKRAPVPLSAAWKKRTGTTKINLRVENSTLGDVIKILQIQTGFNLMIDPRIVSDVVRNPIVGLQLEDAPLSTALTMLAAAAGEDVLWIAQGNVLILTRKELLDGQ